MIKLRLKKYGRKGQPCYRIVALVFIQKEMNPLAAEFVPCGTPPGLQGAKVLAGPPGLLKVSEGAEDDISSPPGLTAPPPGCLHLSCPPGLSLELQEEQDEEDEEECQKLPVSAAPPGNFAPPGKFAPPGMFVCAPMGPPGVFVPSGPPGVLAVPSRDEQKDVDALSMTSTDAESDSEASRTDSSPTSPDADQDAEHYLESFCD
jgi:hypothetical protein